MQIIMYSKNIENVNISLRKTNEIINGKLSQILFWENTISQQSIMTTGTADGDETSCRQLLVIEEENLMSAEQTISASKDYWG